MLIPIEVLHQLDKKTINEDKGNKCYYEINRAIKKSFEVDGKPYVNSDDLIGISLNRIPIAVMIMLGSISKAREFAWQCAYKAADEHAHTGLLMCLRNCKELGGEDFIQTHRKCSDIICEIPRSHKRLSNASKAVEWAIRSYNADGDHLFDCVHSAMICAKIGSKLSSPEVTNDWQNKTLARIMDLKNLPEDL